MRSSPASGWRAGPVVSGVIGQQRFAYDLWGDTVNLASRLEASGESGRVQVSEAVHDRLGGGGASATSASSS